ncbi:ISAs1 family transposase [Longimicrobium terrae]|nr:ISAs1 family transposase [Longimicrobium terrae]NNC32372.1 ISAs1 family transposase [Longimicrobium terrae]
MGYYAGMTLYEVFGELPDVRRAQARQHTVQHVVTCVVLSTLSGNTSWREHGDFVQRHRQPLLEFLRPRKDRLPSYSTIRRVLIGLDFDALSTAFLRWARPRIQVEAGEWWAIDGKCLSGSGTDVHTPQQSFTFLVSLYAHQRGLVLQSGAHKNSKGDEGQVVEAILADAQITGAGVSADALHCKKSFVPS